MLSKILNTLGIRVAAPESAKAVAFYDPYAQPHANLLYNLLFCDDISLFKSDHDTEVGGLWQALRSEPADKAALRTIAEDEANEGRIRALAYNRLRVTGEEIPSKKVLGVIVEVPLTQGLDVLAAFSEGGVRYLNQSGKVAIFEGPGNPVEDLAKELISASQPMVNQIGPSDKQRPPPPQAGNMRLTFLVSGGLSFVEGPFGALRQDAMAGPVVAKATQLLQRTVTLDTP